MIETFRTGSADTILLIALIAAVTSAFSAKTPTGKAARWLWARNISQPFWSKWDQSLDRGIDRKVQPELAAMRAASAAQHDEQNATLAAQSAEMATGFTTVSQRLDKGAEIMATHTTQIAALEKAVTEPRTKRTRAGDP